MGFRALMLMIEAEGMAELMPDRSERIVVVGLSGLDFVEALKIHRRLVLLHIDDRELTELRPVARLVERDANLIFAIALAAQPRIIHVAEIELDRHVPRFPL